MENNCLVTKLKGIVNNPDLPYLFFHDTTIAILSENNVSVNLSDDLQKALDLFVRTLIGANVWGTKISYMCLPFITKLSSNPNVTDATKDVIGTGSFLTNSSSVELYHNGIRPTIGSTTAVCKNDDTGDDFHLSFYNMETEPEHSTSDIGFSLRMKGIGMFVDKNRVRLNVNSSINGDENYKNVPAFRLFNYKSTENSGKAEFYCNGQKVIASNVDWLTPSGKFYQTSFGVYNEDTYGDTAMRSPIGIVSIGKYLTSEEAGIYTNAVNGLMAAVNAYFA